MRRLLIAVFATALLVVGANPALADDDPPPTDDSSDEGSDSEEPTTDGEPWTLASIGRCLAGEVDVVICIETWGTEGVDELPRQAEEEVQSHLIKPTCGHATGGFGNHVAFEAWAFYGVVTSSCNIPTDILQAIVVYLDPAWTGSGSAEQAGGCEQCGQATTKTVEPVIALEDENGLACVVAQGRVAANAEVYESGATYICN